LFSPAYTGVVALFGAALRALFSFGAGVPAEDRETRPVRQAPEVPSQAGGPQRNCPVVSKKRRVGYQEGSAAGGGPEREGSPV